jgi:predicted ribonuclease YlaK
MVIVFPDTNTLLHYPLPPNVDWLRVCEADAAELVLCLQVITELDEKKNDVRLSERAAGVIKSLDIIHEQGGSVRDGVKLNIFNQPVRYEEFREPLSPDNKDDRMVSVDRLSLVFDLGLRTGKLAGVETLRSFAFLGCGLAQC